MAGSYDQNVEGKFKTLDNNNAAPEGAITEVRDTPDKEVLKIIGEAGGKGKDVPPNFKSSDGSDATIVAKTGEANSAAGEKAAVKGPTEQVNEYKYEKYVQTTLGNDTQGSVKETVKTEAADVKEKMAIKEDLQKNKDTDLGKEAAEGALWGAENGAKKAGKDDDLKDKVAAAKDKDGADGAKDGKGDKDAEAAEGKGDKDVKDGKCPDQEAADAIGDAEADKEAEKAEAAAKDEKEHASEAAGEHAKQKEANDPATSNPHTKADADSVTDAMIKKMSGG